MEYSVKNGINFIWLASVQRKGIHINQNSNASFDIRNSELYLWEKNIQIQIHFNP